VVPESRLPLWLAPHEMQSLRRKVEEEYAFPLPEPPRPRVALFGKEVVYAPEARLPMERMQKAEMYARYYLDMRRCAKAKKQVHKAFQAIERMLPYIRDAQMPHLRRLLAFYQKKCES
jgi:hypothetical protein